MAAIITQAFVEAVVQPSPNARPTQVFVEAVVQPSPDARPTQVFVEVIIGLPVIASKIILFSVLLGSNVIDHRYTGISFDEDGNLRASDSIYEGL